MKAEDQKRYFEGAFRHGTLVDAIWEVVSSPSLCVSGDHRGQSMKAIKLAFEVAGVDTEKLALAPGASRRDPIAWAEGYLDKQCPMRKDIDLVPEVCLELLLRLVKNIQPREPGLGELLVAEEIRQRRIKKHLEEHHDGAASSPACAGCDEAYKVTS